MLKTANEAGAAAVESSPAAAATDHHAPPVPSAFADISAHPDSTSAAGKTANDRSQAEAQEQAVDQGPEGAHNHITREGRPQSRSLELPLSILTGSPAKKRGRPYKNTANAEKAALRDARRAAVEAVEKAAWQAASKAAQVAVAAPPAKKRRGRPPKDPAKLAAALAAYHANKHARQASMEAELARGGAGMDTVIDAAQAAAAQTTAAAAAEEPATAAVSPKHNDASPAAAASSPQPAKKKRGRPPKSIAKAVGNNLRSPGVDQPHDSTRQDGIGSDDDDHQALLDAAAVLTSDLPFPQEVRRQAVPSQQPRSRHTKGKRKSGSLTNAGKAAAKAAAPQEKQRRRGLEVVSSRAAALLESIGPESHVPSADQLPSPEPHESPPDDSPAHQGGPPVESDSDPLGPTQAGYPSKRRCQPPHSSQQPATAASGSAGDQVEAAPELSPPLTSPELPQALSESRHDAMHARTDGSSAAVVQTATASSPHLAAAPSTSAVQAATGDMPLPAAALSAC